MFAYLALGAILGAAIGILVDALIVKLAHRKPHEQARPLAVPGRRIVLGCIPHVAMPPGRQREIARNENADASLR